MKKTLLSLSLFFLATALQPCFAGGNTSVVELDKVTSIKIEDDKITIVGSGMIRKRVMSDAEHGDASAFGQPAQMLHAKAIDCTFEIIPYHHRDDISGVPSPPPSKMTAEMLAQSKKWWSDTIAEARKIKVGDAVTIGYQREIMTLKSLYVTHIVGSGFAKIKKPDPEK